LGVLRRPAVLLVVQLEDLADVGQRKPNALAAQDQLQPRSVFVGIDAVQAVPGGIEQPLVFIEAQGPGGRFELLAQLADGEGPFRTPQLDRHGPLPWVRYASTALITDKSR